MYGEPKDVAGECNARLYIADNYGDGEGTIRCSAPVGHCGSHQEAFERREGTVRIEWDFDESIRTCFECDKKYHTLDDTLGFCSPACKKEFDRIFKEKYPEYC